MLCGLSAPLWEADRSGEEGADISPCIVPSASHCIRRKSSTSDTDPFRFRRERENALLKELLSQPFFFFFPLTLEQFAELPTLHADDSEFKLDTESAES